jgi:hypothetical protein
MVRHALALNQRLEGNDRGCREDLRVNFASRAMAAAGIAVVVAVVASAWQLLRARYATGDAHPPYSSLRTDPLGARVLHDALDALPDRSARRLFRAGAMLEEAQRTTVLVLGVHPAETAAVEASLVREMEDCARAGGRVVITLLPIARDDWNSRRLERRAGRTGLPQELDSTTRVSLRERWGFETEYTTLPTKDDNTVEPIEATRTAPAASELPARLPWNSGVRLGGIDDSWETVFSVNDAPVLVVRRMGAGSIVLSTDAYPFSNESLRKQRQTQLLSWYLADGERVAFEETHLGLTRTVGVAGLARRYRLHGFLAGALILAALVTWSSGSRLVPRSTTAAVARPIQGLDSSSGLSNLIRRCVPERELPRVCFEEWQAANPGQDPRLTLLLARLGGIIATEASRPRHQRDTVGAVAQMFAATAEHRTPAPRGSANSGRFVSPLLPKHRP